MKRIVVMMLLTAMLALLFGGCGREVTESDTVTEPVGEAFLIPQDLEEIPQS